MRLGEVWDYFMRRKLLLLSVVVALAGIVFLGEKLSARQADEIAEIEIPRTGEVSVIEKEVPGCDAEAVDWSGMVFGNGENAAEEITDIEANMTFWGAEAPTAIIKAEDYSANDGEKIESVIITLGILAAVAVLGAGKIVFDRYVR